jgi:DNA-binding response OmpR family regulator
MSSLGAFDSDARLGLHGDASHAGAGVESAEILVVEHNAELGRALAEQLAADGYLARLALTAEHARVLLRERRPAAAILGKLDSPRGALDLLREIRRATPCSARSVTPPWPRDQPSEIRRAMPRGAHSDTPPWPRDMPAIVLGAPTLLDLVRAFEAGADDFLARPAVHLELRVRLRALLRRAAALGEECLVVGPLRLDLRSQTVTLHDRPVPLRRQEYLLLLQLAREPTRVFARSELLREVWGFPAACSTRTLDTHASRLRRALAGDGHRWVLNVRGVGYRLT